VLLLRALGGDAAHPTRREAERAVTRALAGAEADGEGAETGATWLGRLASGAATPTRRLAFAALAVAIAGAWLLWARAPVAEVMEARGLVVDGRVAREGDDVRSGDRLEVGRSGVAVLRLARGGELAFAAGSTAVLGARGEELRLERSKVRCDIARGAGEFRVRTDTATAIVLGTSFVVERRSDATTEVRVREGAVRVEDAGERGEVTVRGGERARVRGGAPPSRVSRYDGLEDGDLAEALRSFGRKLRRGVEGLLDELRAAPRE
jgi:ferric-dicitrate binding protein FerR (iron transport regulator)